MSFPIISGITPLSPSLITPIDSPMQEEKKIKTAEEAVEEMASSPFAFCSTGDESYYSGTHHSKVYIFYSGRSERLIESAHYYLGGVNIPGIRSAACAYDQQTGKYFLKRDGEPTEEPSLQYETLRDLLSQHPLTSPHTIFDQPLTTESLMMHVVGGVMNEKFFFEQTQIFKDEPIGSYFISYNCKNGFFKGYVAVKVNDENNFIALQLPQDWSRPFIPNPLDISGLKIDEHTFKVRNENELQMKARLQQLVQQNLISHIDSHLDFSRLLDIDRNKRRMYIDKLTDVVKSKVSTLRLGHRGDFNLLTLMVEFAANCPTIKKIVIPVSPDPSSFPLLSSESDSHSEGVTMGNTFPFLSGSDCSFVDLMCLEENLNKLKREDFERYNSLLLSFLPSLVHYIEKTDWDAYYKGHFEVKSSLKDDRDLLESGEFSDFALVAEGKSIPVHRGILVRFTDNLRQVIRSEYKDSKSTEKVIEGYTYDIVKKALQYIYSDETVQYNFEDYFGLCKLANEWGIVKLRQRSEAVIVWNVMLATNREGCRNLVIENLDDLLFNNVMWSIWDQDTQAYILDNLGKILPYIQENVDEDYFYLVVHMMLERWKDLMRFKIKEAKNPKQLHLKV